MAAAMVMGQYWEQISAFAATAVSEHGSAVYNPGPAAIFVAIPLPDQTNLGYLFLIEFFVDSFIAMVIWACLDPANPFVAPSSAPFTIGLVYAVMVWGFADITISTNLARDLGCRCLAACFYGNRILYRAKQLY